MIAGINVAEVAALIGDVTRANLLLALMDGRALTATELAHRAGVTPQTTSAHLAKLSEARILAMEAQGRHRYYRLASPAVAQAIEALMQLAADGPKRHRPPGPRDEAIRTARTCYDHLAGRLGVGIADGLLERGLATLDDGAFALTAEGERTLGGWGLDLAAARRQRRAFARSCLDWSERRPHIGGALGAAVAELAFTRGWIARQAGERAVRLTGPGRQAIHTHFGLHL